MATSSREARRRRILEGRSERLAFVTGRAQTLSSTSQHDSDGAGGTSQLFSQHHDLKSYVSYQQPTVSLKEEDKLLNYTLPKHVQAEQSNSIDTVCGGSREELHSLQAETGHMSSKAHGYEVYDKAESSAEIQREPPLASNAGHLSPKIHLGDLFTCKRITSAVAATKQTRMFCSLAMAFLVVLSYMGFPIVSSALVRSIIHFRPLFLVLLTNITLILLLLLSEEQKVLERAWQEAYKSPTADRFLGWAEEASKALEMVLMAQSVMGALFMDCAIYSIIVICGLSVA